MVFSLIDCFFSWRRNYREPMRLYIEGWTTDMGHSRPIHSAPVPVNVRYASNSDRFLRRSETTLSAISDIAAAVHSK
jgi:hypothetical protein